MQLHQEIQEQYAAAVEGFAPVFPSCNIVFLSVRESVQCRMCSDGDFLAQGVGLRTCMDVRLGCQETTFKFKTEELAFSSEYARLAFVPQLLLPK